MSDAKMQLKEVYPISEGYNSKTMMLCAWCGPLAILVWLVGFALAGFIPPPSPSDSAQEVQSMYLNHTNMIRIGLVFTLWAAALDGVFVAVISAQMKRIEGRYSPLTYVQLGLGMLGVILFIIPCFMMETAAFRPERDPALTQLLNDASWLPFVGAVPPGIFQLLAIAVCIFQDKQQRVFPRWLGYVNLWVALLLLPAGLVVFFRQGPFTWNGVLGFWLPLSAFCGWFLVMFVQLRKTILKQSGDATP